MDGPQRFLRIRREDFEKSCWDRSDTGDQSRIVMVWWL